MKRFFYLMLLSGLFSLILFFASPPPQQFHADSGSDSLAHKVSGEIRQKVANGHGSDSVRVIIQPAGAWDSDLDSTVEDSGGANVRQFRNFQVRIVTLPANA